MSRRGQEDAVLDPRLMPSGAESTSGAAGGFTASPYAQHSSDAGINVGYRLNQPYYIAQPPRLSTASSVEERPVEQEEGYSGDDTHQSPAGDDSKRPRACEACRGLKVRCDQDPNHPDQPCKRCAKAGRQCVITQPSRKRQKKADTRVADLERKLDALTAVLHAQQNLMPNGLNQTGLGSAEAQTSASRSSTLTSADRPAPYPLPAYAPPGAAQPLNNAYSGQTDMSAPPIKRRRVSETEIVASTCVGDLPRTSSVDQRDDRSRWNTLSEADSERLSRRGLRRELYHVAPEALIARICELVDPALHEKIFARFVHDLVPNLPAIIFPTGTTAKEVLESKPYLFLCIVAAASVGLVSYHTQNELADEVLSIWTDCVMKHGVRSLELIQAMLVSVLWGKPPERPEQANFYFIIHLAACMGLDIGLGRRFSPSKARRGFGGPAQNLPPGRLTALVDSDSIEARRTWLACYFVCASCAQSTRRPNLIRWSNYMQECVDVLETSPEAALSGRLFTQHIRIQKICEDISNSFSMDDASATSISISDPKVSYTLDIYEQKLKDWKDRLPDDLKDRPQLLFFYNLAILYLHEIAMHVNHNVDDFRLPFTEETLRSGTQYSEVLTQKQMAALESCLHAAHRQMDIFLSFSFEVLSGLPTLFYYVRCIYAIVVLIKMHMAVTSPGSEVGKIIKPEDIKVAEILDRLWTRLVAMSKQDMTKPHSKIMKIMGVLREWFLAHKDGDLEPGESNTAKVAPHGRHMHGNQGDSRLQVLSEAATAGSQVAPDSTTRSTNSNWTFDSPQPLHFHHRSRGQSNGESSGPSPDTHGSSANTPRQNSLATPTYNGYTMPGMSTQQDKTHFSSSNSYNDPFNNSFSPSGGMDNLNWTADLNLEQVLDGAFRDIDMSGDLGGWFLGDGVSTYQIPEQGSAPQPGGNDGGQSRW